MRPLPPPTSSAPVGIAERELTRLCEPKSTGQSATPSARSQDRVLTRRPQLTLRTIDDSAAEHVEASENPAEPTRPTPDQPVEDASGSGQFGELLAALSATNSLLASIAAALAAHIPHDVDVDSRVRASSPRERANEPRESFARSEEFKERREEGKDLLPSVTCSNDARVEPARTRESDSRAATDYENLLGPLDEMARRMRLPTAGNRARLYGALDGYGDASIAGAVGRLCDDLRRGTQITSPFGLLLHKAEHHDLTYFAPLTPTSPPPAEIEPDGVNDVVDELTVLAEQQLAEMDADPHRWHTKLTDLEQAVDVEIRRQTPGHAERLLTMAPLRRAVRLDLYRARLADERSIP
jgi:hypothetical protein